MRKPSAMILIRASEMKIKVKSISKPSKIFFRYDYGSANGSSKAKINELTKTEMFIICVKIVLAEGAYHLGYTTLMS